MATPNPYFLYPFGSSGDATAIDSTTGTNAGVVNYQYGFTPNYELNLASAPAALPIPRAPFNQLMLDVTTALQNLQQFGASPWVAPATGSPPIGGPANYPLYARVFYAPVAGAYAGVYVLWESQVAANTSVPGDNSDWLAISGKSGQVGDVIYSSSPNGRAGSIKCDGSNVLRADYLPLFSALTVSQSASSTNTSTTLTVTSTANVSAGTNALIEGTGITPGTYVVSILSGTTLQMSAPAIASGTSTMIFFIWGNTGNANTTFNLPLLYRKVPVGATGQVGTSVLGGYLGQSGGTETYKQLTSDVAPHNHTGTVALKTGVNSVSGPGIYPNPLAGSTDLTINNNQSVDTQTAMPLIQPSVNLWGYVQY